MKLVIDKLDKSKDLHCTVPRGIVYDFRKGLSGEAKNLYHILYTSNQNSKKGKVFTPSDETLASICKVDIRTIKRWIRQLRRFGYVTMYGCKETGFITIVHKRSQGEFNVEEQGAKYITIKTIKDREAKVTKLTHFKVTNTAPIISTMPPAECVGGIDNRLDDKIKDKSNQLN